MKVIVAGLLAVSLLGGCASEVLKSYVGKSIQEPILDYGPPSNVVKMNDGQRAYQWSINQSGVVPISTPSTSTVVGSGGFAVVNSTSTSYVPYSNQCLYTLIASPNKKDWIVTSFRQPRLDCE